MVRVGDRKEHPPGGREEASFGALGCICKSCESFLSSDPLSVSNQPILRRVDLAFPLLCSGEAQAELCPIWTGSSSRSASEREAGQEKVEF